MDRSSLGRGSTSSAASGSGTASSKEEKIDQLFYRYATKSSGVIDPSGIDLLCADLQLDDKDYQMLLLSWKMKARRKGYFTVEEWRRGLTTLHAYTLPKLRDGIYTLYLEVRVPSNFLKLYSYAFKYSLTDVRQKTLDIETICDMLELILGSDHRAQVDALIAYLKAQRDYWMISKDQWLGFYRFCKEINFPSLNNYSLDHAWPVILDNFVEWMKSTKE
ncbi:uncharacterized protein LOC127263114 isoform X1 [Andrographis paniculata]|uniref:uncharacterized protein LOC127263114 isoform X1 n=1 Tax=Andrographis paniculata TaxID=175694 RepID=UPI0021E8913F|nr:uncharacterized protein LOC127263114 isoform X1 [Andrographis paniculata]XP_051148032.1 uncharacterized protein LOC127263114 isoform X1 [Andrographis paniculata]